MERKRAEADALVQPAMRLEDITPRVWMATYGPHIAILVESAIQLQDEANKLEAEMVVKQANMLRDARPVR